MTTYLFTNVERERDRGSVCERGRESMKVAPLLHPPFYLAHTHTACLCYRLENRPPHNHCISAAHLQRSLLGSLTTKLHSLIVYRPLCLVWKSSVFAVHRIGTCCSREGSCHVNWGVDPWFTVLAPISRIRYGWSDITLPL